MTLHEGGNYNGTRRHYVRAWTLKEPRGGMGGEPLCRLTRYVYDQDWHDKAARKVVADMPLCRLCQRAAAKGGVA
jgi:hypothetical protein